MSRILLYFFFISTLIVLITGCNEPSNYDECILKYVKEDMNERAVNAVISACSSKFWDQEDETDSDIKVSNNEIDNKLAIEIVKNAHTLSTSRNNERYIRSELKEIVGSLEIIGWQSRKINDQTFSVNYFYKHNDVLNAYTFKFNTKANIIRDTNPKLLPPTEEELEK